MTAKKSVGESLVEAMTEFTEALESGGPLDTKLTGHTLSIDLTPKRYTAQEVRATRRLLGTSQSFFARFIGVALGTVRAWEQGRNVPSGAAARLLDEIRLNPDFWKGRRTSTLIRVSKKCISASCNIKRRRADTGDSRNHTATVGVKKLASGSGPLQTSTRRRTGG